MKSCLGIKNQEYAPGVLRPVGADASKIERCNDGKWVPNSPAKGGM